MNVFTQTFDGKVCVITGAASGIGRALAITLGEAGAALALSDVNEAGLAETAAMAGGDNSNRIITDVLDVSNAKQVAAYAARVESALGPADYLFNVAGLTRVGDFVDTPLSSMETVMDVNFWGVVRMSKAFIDQLLITKGGLINISSLFGLVGYAGQTHYCASKFAVRGFTETLAQEMDGTGVTVSCVHPGGVATNIARNAKVDKLKNAGTKIEDLHREFDQMAITPVAKAAEIILKGAAKGQRRIMVGKDAKMLSFIQRLFPASYPKYVAKISGKNTLN